MYRAMLITLLVFIAIFVIALDVRLETITPARNNSTAQ